MINTKYYINLKIWFLHLLWLTILLLITWCGGGGNKHNLNIEVEGFVIEYNWKVWFEQVSLLKDDNDDIISLYQEIWDWSSYKDSLLVAKKYSLWLWVNAFAQSNMDTLQDNWLTLSNIKKTQLWLLKDGQKINAVLVEYEISEWLIHEIPLLYNSQLFVELDNDIILFSFVTEDQSLQHSISNAFKNIK